MRSDYFGDCLKKIEHSRADNMIGAAQAKGFQRDVMGKIEQKQKLDQDFALGKITPKLYNEWDANIRRDVSRISDEIDFVMEQRRKAKRAKKRLVAVGVVASVCAVYAAFAIPLYFHAHRTIAGIPEPVQISIGDLVSEAKERGEEIETGKTIGGDGYRAAMTYLASYDIKGLVVEVDDYDGRDAQSFDKAIPRDISLAWGASAEFSDEIKWSHGNRKLKYEYGGDIFQKHAITMGDLTSSVSNNHILVDDKGLYRKLKRVRIGDYIEMKGFLVEATITDEAGRGAYTVRSSLVRTDYSTSVFDRKTSCEIMYITSLEWLD